MKKLLIILIIQLLGYSGVSAQSCFPNGVFFIYQSEIDSFQTNFPNCTEIEGDVEIKGGNITNLNGLSVIVSIGGSLEINSCFNLLNLNGLEYLTSISNNLWLKGNQEISNLNGLDNLSFIGGNIEIIGNPSLIDLTGLESLTSIENDLFIGDYYHGSNNSLVNFNGLNNVTKIEGTFHIELVQSLQNFVGLENLSVIGNNLIISFGNVLNSLTGLENLNTINGDLMFSTMWNLPNLTSLENLTYIGGNLSFWNNDALISLNGLENLSSLGGYLRIYENDSLKDINSLRNIDPASITDLKIEENTSLSNCDIKSICSYLSNPNGVIDISSNKQGCNNKTEVQNACLDWISTTKSDNCFSFFPNPANESILLLNKYNLEITEINVYDLAGLEIFHINHSTDKVDVSKLDNGIYVIELVTVNLIIRNKLIIER